MCVTVTYKCHLKSRIEVIKKHCVIKQTQSVNTVLHAAFVKWRKSLHVGLGKMCHACFANIAKLKAWRLRKPIPPCAFDMLVMIEAWMSSIMHNILVEGSGLEDTNQRHLKKLSKKMIDMWSERKWIVIDQAGIYGNTT